MEVDPDHGGNNGNDGFKIAELERRLTEETDRCFIDTHGYPNPDPILLTLFESVSVSE